MMAHISGENTEYLRRHGVPDVRPTSACRRRAASSAAGTGRRADHLLADGTSSRSATGARSRSSGRRGTRGPLLSAPEARWRALRRRPPAAEDHPHVGLWPNGPENPLGDFLASHEKIQRVDARLVCPAHGPVYEDHRRRARQLIDFHRVRKLAMLERIRRRPLTAYEVALDVFAIAPDNRFQVFAATLETLAHLELLRREDALRDERDGVVRYQGR
jgi:hypothetical protein